MHANSSGLRIAYRRLGKPGGLPLLIVHGLSYTSADWVSVAERLGNEREVVCIDMRGFGDSDWSPKKDYSVPTMAQDIVNVLDHAGWSQAVLIGHSMGGRSTTYAAAKNAQRIAGLALIDYTPENAPAGTQRTTKTVANTPNAFSSIDDAMKYFGKTDRTRFEAYLKKTDGGYSVKRDTHFRDQFKKLLETGERPKLGVDMWQLIGEVRCPILSMRGSRSDMYAPETREKMRAANPRLEVVEVDAGHDIAGENEAALVEVLKKWIPAE